MGLTNRSGLVIDGLAVDSAATPEEISMSVWISSAATIKVIYRPRTDTAATKKHVEVMTSSLERGRRLHFTHGEPSH
ncbi:hypothetical protein ACHABQ_14065 [Nesterenkonia aurantiaca]|uniref:hypothetical protein n=1 Tax=Nesterenkonia aurantiaca TaxID=1436010 RepID=UPI003EE72873